VEKQAVVFFVFKS